MPPNSRHPTTADRALLFVCLGFLLLLPCSGIAALRTVLIFAAFVLTVWVGVKEAPAKPPLLWVFAAWAAAALLATIGASSPIESLQQLKGEVGFSLLLYVAFFLTTGTKAFFLFRRTATLSLAILGGGAIIAALCTGGKWVDGYYNQLGEYNTFVITTIPLTLTALVPSSIQAERKERWLFTIALLIALLASFVSKSRGIWGDIAFIGIAMALYTWRHTGAHRIKTGLVAALIVGITLGAAFFVTQQRGMGFNTGNDRSLIYSASIEHIMERPIFGHGFGRTSSRAYYEVVTPDKGLIQHPHNLFLSYADQAGLFGIVALLCIFGALSVRFIILIRKAQQPIFAVAGLTLVIVVILRSMPDMFFYGQNLWLFWAHCGILMRCAQSPETITK